MTNLITSQRPEARAVRSDHFVTQHNLTLFVQAKFKLGISNDDAASQSVICTFFVDGNGIVPNLQSVFLATTRIELFQNLNAALHADVFIMVANFCLSAGSEEHLGQLLALLQALRQLNATNFATFLVASPAATSDIATHDAFYRQHFQLLAFHAVAGEFLFLEEFGHVLYINR